MAITLNQMTPKTQASTYFSQGFRRTLEANMAWLRTHPNTTQIAVNPHDSYKYEGDLYGLLLTLGIKREHHWLVMRLNNILRPGDVDPNLTSLLVPDLALVDRMQQMYTTRAKKTGTLNG